MIKLWLRFNNNFLIGSIAMSIIYGLKVNLSVAMVAMLNHTAIRESSNLNLNQTTVIQVVTQINTGDDACMESSSAGAIEVNHSHRFNSFVCVTLKLFSFRMDRSFGQSHCKERY